MNKIPTSLHHCLLPHDFHRSFCMTPYFLGVHKAPAAQEMSCPHRILPEQGPVCLRWPFCPKEGACCHAGYAASSLVLSGCLRQGKLPQLVRPSKSTPADCIEVLLATCQSGPNAASKSRQLVVLCNLRAVSVNDFNPTHLVMQDQEPRTGHHL